MAAEQASLRIGIDLGGTKTEVVALGERGAILHRRRLATPRGDYPATIATIVSLVESTERILGARATVGVGIPGSLSPDTGLVRNANSTWINGRPFDKDLARALGREVRIGNDANCLAVSEAVDGAGAGKRVVFAAILGTGVGSGIAIDGLPLTGRNGIGGEWGHNPLPWPTADERPGPPCFCGRSGCVETFVSGPGLARDYHLAAGVSRSGSEIVVMAENGDAQAMASLDRFLDRLARAVAVVVNIIDPDVIVFGGGLSRIARIYEELPQRLSGYVFSDGFATPVRPAQHGDSSGVRGAAWLWPPHAVLAEAPPGSVER